MPKEITAPSEANSETGLTVGLIDAIQAVCHALVPFDLSEPEVTEALYDLYHSHDFQFLSAAAQVAFKMKAEAPTPK